MSDIKSLPVDINNFLCADNPLKPASAVAALLLQEDGKYLMQLRDKLPNIFYPGHWGCFGGAIDAGESKEAALVRELKEELGITIHKFKQFISINFDYRSIDLGIIERTYYLVDIPDKVRGEITLGEGSQFEGFTASELLANMRVTPYDSFAVWVHQNQKRLIA